MYYSFSALISTEEDEYPFEEDGPKTDL